MIKLGVFILPPKRLEKSIKNYKKKIQIRYGSQKYLSHPPHCTLCVLNISKKSLNNIKNIKFSISKSKKKYKIKNFDFFKNDPITKGNTLILKVDKNNFLNELQSEVLTNFNKYIWKIKKSYKNKIMNKNYKKFGYPFVGKNWVPHFTIASLSKKINIKEIIENFKFFTKQNVNLRVNNVHLFEIKKNHHKLICIKKIL